MARTNQNESDKNKVNPDVLIKDNQKLADFILKEHADEITDGSAIENAIRIIQSSDKETKALADFLLGNYPDEVNKIEDETAVQCALRLLKPVPLNLSANMSEVEETVKEIFDKYSTLDDDADNESIIKDIKKIKQYDTDDIIAALVYIAREYEADSFSLNRR